MTANPVFRGLIYALVLSAPLWLIIGLAAWWLL